MRLISVLIIGLTGLFIGAVVGFIGAVVIRPEASPEFVFWGALGGAVVLLWVLECFGTLIKGAIWGLAGAGVGYAVGWLISLKYPQAELSLMRWGSIVGAFCFACWPPRFGGFSQGKLLNVRGQSSERQAEREAAGFVMPTGSVELPEPPPFNSDGIKININQLQSELKQIAPEMNFGTAETPDGDSVPEEIYFYAANLEYVQGEFFQYLAQRMAAEGVSQWTEAKFDCDDFAHYLSQCGTMCILKSKLEGATHAFFVSTVQIDGGAQLLGVGGKENGCHANNLVRCTDGNWYFVEPQAALRPGGATSNPVAMALRKVKATQGIVRSVSAGGEGFWMCPANQALKDNDVSLLQAKF